MARYRLPEALGGFACDIRDHYADRCLVMLTEGTYTGLTIELDRSALTEVPLPEEPPAFSVVQIGASFFEKRDDAGINWWDIAAQTWLTWEQICSIGTPVRLVPDPFAEPVVLPWEAHDDGVDATDVDVRHRRVEVAAGFRFGRKDLIVRVHVGGANGIALSSGTARDMARALWAAAAAADKEQS